MNSKYNGEVKIGDTVLPITEDNLSISNAITTEQLKQKMEPILSKMYVFAQIPDKMVERKLWAEVYKDICCALFPDEQKDNERG